MIPLETVTQLNIGMAVLYAAINVISLKHINTNENMLSEIKGAKFQGKSIDTLQTNYFIILLRDLLYLHYYSRTILPLRIR